MGDYIYRVARDLSTEGGCRAEISRAYGLYRGFAPVVSLSMSDGSVISTPRHFLWAIFFRDPVFKMTLGKRIINYDFSDLRKARSFWRMGDSCSECIYLFESYTLREAENEDNGFFLENAPPIHLISCLEYQKIGLDPVTDCKKRESSMDDFNGEVTLLKIIDQTIS